MGPSRCGIAAVLDHGANDNGSGYVLIEQLLEDAAGDGADVGLLFRPPALFLRCQTVSRSFHDRCRTHGPGMPRLEALWNAGAHVQWFSL
jgi:hypothetical protein